MIFRRGFGGAAIGWAVALPIATWIAAGPHRAWPSSVFAFMVYRIGSVLCHQAPDRSFQLWAMQMPVCARCTGIYVGAAAAVLVAASARSRWLPGPAGRAVIIAAVLPSLATVAFEWVTGDTPSGLVRAVAGAPIGAVVAWLIVDGEAREVN
jgi:hypothetical protein